jgi:hypothetical protein
MHSKYKGWNEDYQQNTPEVVKVVNGRLIRFIAKRNLIAIKRAF